MFWNFDGFDVIDLDDVHREIPSEHPLTLRAPRWPQILATPQRRNYCIRSTPSYADRAHILAGAVSQTALTASRHGLNDILVLAFDDFDRKTFESNSFARALQFCPQNKLPIERFRHHQGLLFGKYMKLSLSLTSFSVAKMSARCFLYSVSTQERVQFSVLESCMKFFGRDMECSGTRTESHGDSPAQNSAHSDPGWL